VKWTSFIVNIAEAALQVYAVLQPVLAVGVRTAKGDTNFMKAMKNPDTAVNIAEAVLRA
jgi:hypothetical protein